MATAYLFFNSSSNSEMLKQTDLKIKVAKGVQDILR